MSTKDKISPVIVALDYDNQQSALSFVDQISPQDCRLKIGKEMFTRFGPELVRLLQNKGFDIFLDLKFHDIPNTVAKAVSAAADLGVWMIDVHATGGVKMLEAAKRALEPYGHDAPKLVAITVLTSMTNEDLNEIGCHMNLADYAELLAKLSYQSGLDGVVCSPLEAQAFKGTFGKAFLLVTPGIRPLGSENMDQRRVMTPEQAISVGVDYMVIGRPITQAAQPAEVLRNILKNLH